VTYADVVNIVGHSYPLLHQPTDIDVTAHAYNCDSPPLDTALEPTERKSVHHFCTMMGSLDGGAVSKPFYGVWQRHHVAKKFNFVIAVSIGIEIIIKFVSNQRQMY